MASRRVAACVVTGFLGSGKTTLLRGLLDRAPSRERIAVVVNEVGEIGIDGRVLAGFDFADNVVELASGCVCCSIDEYRFDLAVDELVRRLDPALLVIETSGVADPGPTLERLRRCGVGVDAVVTVVDARAWQTAWRVSAVARRQIEAADFIVVSKRDLVTERALGRLRAKLAAINARALVLEGAGSDAFTGSELLLATSASVAARRDERQNVDVSSREDATAAARSPEDPMSVEPAGGHVADDGIESFAWRSAAAFDRPELERALRALPASVLRAKGIVARADGRGAWLFHVVCGRIELAAFGGAWPSGAEGVFLGTGIERHRERIVAALESAAAAAGIAETVPTA